MYLAGVSVRRVEDITEALWGTRVSPSTVSDLNRKILRDDRGVAQPADRGRASLRLSRRHRAQAQLGWRGTQRLASGGDRRERRGLSGDFGICEGAKEDKAGWSAFLIISRSAVSTASGWSSRTPAWGLPRVPPSSSRRPPGNAGSWGR